MSVGWHRVAFRVLGPGGRACFSTSSRWRAPKPLAMDDFTCDLIRNFSIIAHIDHGKSTLADRLLELTGTIKKKEVGKNEQVLDKLKVERERGITVKAQTASMMHSFGGKQHVLNLIDTPGHVDFAWEVSRSLAACQGALLLVDASQGVQAQTISVFHIAQERGLKIIPVLNKIDLPAAQPERIAAQMQSTFGTDPTDIIQISAKTGRGVDQVLQAIVDRIPPPSGTTTGPLKAFLFDSMYDRYRGVISLVALQDGILKKGDRIASCHTKKKYEITDIGILNPEEIPVTSLHPGQVGYIACNMKESSEAHIGDTLYRVGAPVDPMPGFKPAKAMVYAGIFPIDTSDFPKLEESIKRLALTDRSVTIQRESSTALGQGCRLGFLGTLHMDDVSSSLFWVPYKIVYKDKEVYVSNPTEFPDAIDVSSKVKEVQEPVVKASIIVPEEYFGEMMDLCFTHRAEELEHKYLDAGTGTESRIMLTCVIPLSEIVTDFFDQLKSRSSGFASFDYEEAGYKPSNLAKVPSFPWYFFSMANLSMPLALVVHRSHEDAIGKLWVKKLVKVIPRQMFEVPIQAAVGKKIIARETLSAYRADVTAGLYGGHVERKMKASKEIGIDTLVLT
ncbi:Translation factor GUF1, mitochondrial [Mycena venus]|uniref:Translation factor GUF1, mitochondrial n=1 Tax=Mycena venus TaxID=2733690 RepID=A0A8H6XB87_9AGAR|nr:Translation factor GUF1, mitochondrial [Mycena venus]